MYELHFYGIKDSVGYPYTGYMQCMLGSKALQGVTPETYVYYKGSVALGCLMDGTIVLVTHGMEPGAEVSFRLLLGASQDEISLFAITNLDKTITPDLTQKAFDHINNIQNLPVEDRYIVDPSKLNKQLIDEISPLSLFWLHEPITSGLEEPKSNLETTTSAIDAISEPEPIVFTPRKESEFFKHGRSGGRSNSLEFSADDLISGVTPPPLKRQCTPLPADTQTLITESSPPPLRSPSVS